MGGGAVSGMAGRQETGGRGDSSTPGTRFGRPVDQPPAVASRAR